MIDIDGIDFIDKDGYIICFINNLSDQFKNLIQKNLCMICNGKSSAENPKEYNNYKNTVKELNKRIKDKKESTLKIGIVGELLVHTIFSNYFTDYQSLSPLFNMEERSAKKGFDLVLFKDNEIWINEVKSGNLHKDKTQDETIEELINVSKLDLKKRLNDGNLMLWLNAISHAKIALDRYNDEKEVVENILNEIYTNTKNDKLQGKNTNVFLTGVLFHNINEKFLESTIKSKLESVKSESLFKNLIVIAIQQEICDDIIDFLKGEEE